MKLALLACALAASMAHGAATTCDAVRDCGADPTNSSIATSAIQGCINKCSTSGPGSTVTINGNFLISTLDFSNSSGLTVVLGPKTTLHAVADPSLFPLVPFLPPVGSKPSYRPILYGTNVHNLTIRGSQPWSAFDPASRAVVDGNGWGGWWQNYSKGTLKYQRPKLLEIVGSSGLTIEDIVVQNSPMWTLHPFAVSHVRISRVVVLAPRAQGNTDGVHLSTTNDAVVSDTHIDVGDDAFTATSYPWSNGTCVPTRDILIENTTMLSRNFAIGSQTFCGVSNLTMRGGRIGDDGGNAGGAGSSPWAVKVKAHPIQGGLVEDITFDGVRFGRITPNSWQQPHGGMAITMYQTYAGSQPPPNNSPTPTTFRNILFRNIVVTYAEEAAEIRGVRDGSISNMTFSNFTVLDQSHMRNPWSCTNVTGTNIIGTVSPRPKAGECGTA